MNVAQALAERRAVKGFDPDFGISDTDMRGLLSEVAANAPSAFNIQHWRFVWVRDPQLRQDIRKVAWNQAQVTDASALLVMTASLKAWEQGARYWQGAPQPFLDFIVPAIDAYYRGKPQVERDECFRSMGLAAMSVMLLAQHRGYDTCPMDGFDFEAVGRLINLPAGHVVGLMIAVGRRSQEPRPRGYKLPLDEVLVTDRFPQGA